MRIFGIAAFLLFLLGVHTARAQDSLPSVEIDTSVLEELGQPKTDAPAQILSRPPITPERPSLVLDQPVAPPQRQAEIPQIENSPSTPPKKAPVDASYYPIKTVVHSETVDPAFDKTPEYEIVPQPQKTQAIPDKKQAAAQKPEVKPQQKTARAEDHDLTPLPVPQRAPSAKVRTAAVVTASLAPTPTAPVPSRKPANIEKRAEWIAALDKPKTAPRKIDTGPVRMAGKPSMPAVPAGQVISEKLPGSIHDPLASLLVLPDKEKLLKMVETIAGQALGTKKTAAAAPVPPKPPRLVTTRATKMTKEEATRIADITALAAIEPSAGKQEYAADLTENFNQVIETRKAVKTTGIKEKEKKAEADVTEITEKAEKTADDKKTFQPRPPPELAFDSEFVSLPFPQGLSQIDDQIQSALQGRILPVLKDNPGLRIQIQAFAQPRDNKAVSARRLSLARALSIRSWLLDQGIDPSRMDVRALGMETDRNPADRVDMVFVDPAQL